MRSTDEQPMPRWQEIAQLAVDDEATPQELRELESFLARSAEAREFNESLRQLIGDLRALAPVEPSQSCGQAVLDNIRRNPSSVAPQPAVSPWRPAAARRRVVIGVAWAAAVVIVAVLASLPAITGRHSERVLPVDVAGSAVSLSPERWPIASHTVAGDWKLVVRRHGELAMVTVDGPSAPLTLRWSNADMEPAGAWPVDAGTLATTANEHRFTFNAATPRGGLLVRPARPAAAVSVDTGGREVLTTTISLE